MKTYSDLTNLVVSINNYLIAKNSKKRVAIHVVGANNNIEISITHEEFGILSNCVARNNKEAFIHLYQLVIMSIE